MADDEDAPPQRSALRGRQDPPLSMRQLVATRPVLQVQSSGLSLLSEKDAIATVIGVKALGLLALPEPWVPPFFVIASEAVPAANDEGFFKLCREALKQSALAPEVIVRSSGVAETMQHRGRLVSEVCSAADVPTVVQRLARAVETDHTDHVHWVVQANVKPSRQGHLSNERRLSYEPRDWVLEVEQQDQRPGYTSPIAIRTWRDGSLQSATELRCGSEAQIALQLKSVSVWALQFGRRMHFEWVWTGSRLWIVQADLADTNVGVDPHSLLPTEIPAITPAMLAVVVPATSEQLSRYGKLRNVQLYAQLGYAMPQFYMLESESILQSVLHGHVPAELASDLEELTKRPLIIRTDGSAIPADKREMLPRSDELRSAADAVKWLTTDFRNRVLAAHLETAGLCLIAHHFIPSIASAWARAEPKKRMVRIESLWGLPEGLYWYSHDTFEVDSDTGGFTDRRRYKGTFVASDSEGRWIPMTTAAPFDWRRSIRRTEWIREIASTTRTIADRAGYSVSVMWLVDNDSRVTSHRVLPWFHSKSALSGAPKAAPRKKLTTARDQTVQNRSDWEHTKTQIAAGRHIERLIVAPVDPDLIRDQQFVEELATAAARHQIVIELAGGVLSHAYYVLTRHGAQVECVDLFGTDPEIREFNKLVRDKIPRSIQARGEDVAVVSLKGDAYLAALRQKLVEEAYEALDARGGGEIVAELADVQEVVRAISHALQIPFSQVEEEREDKRLKKGGFERGVMLTTTSTPYSLSREETEAKPTTLEGDPGGIPQPTVLRPEEIPTNPPYRKPDLRTAGDKPEKLFTFETELSRTTDRLTKQTTTFVMPVDRESSREFTLTIEFSRERGVLRVTVRFRLEPQQLPIGLDDQLRLDFREDERTVESPNETSQAARKKD